MGAAGRPPEMPLEQHARRAWWLSRARAGVW